MAACFFMGIRRTPNVQIIYAFRSYYLFIRTNFSRGIRLQFFPGYELSTATLSGEIPGHALTKKGIHMNPLPYYILIWVLIRHFKGYRNAERYVNCFSILPPGIPSWHG